MELFHKPEFWLIVLTAVSEIIGMSKMKENSVAQLVLSLIENGKDGKSKGKGKGKNSRPIRSAKPTPATVPPPQSKSLPSESDGCPQILLRQKEGRRRQGLLERLPIRWHVQRQGQMRPYWQGQKRKTTLRKKKRGFLLRTLVGVFAFQGILIAAYKYGTQCLLQHVDRLHEMPSRSHSAQNGLTKTEKIFAMATATTLSFLPRRG